MKLLAISASQGTDVNGTAAVVVERLPPLPPPPYPRQISMLMQGPEGLP